VAFKYVPYDLGLVLSVRAFCHLGQVERTFIYELIRSYKSMVLRKRANGRERSAMWLGRQDSNLGMAESKSDQFACEINAHSEKIAKFDC
jgi:hypothetical protein